MYKITSRIMLAPTSPRFDWRTLIVCCGRTEARVFMAEGHTAFEYSPFRLSEIDNGGTHTVGLSFAKVTSGPLASQQKDMVRYHNETIFKKYLVEHIEHLQLELQTNEIVIALPQTSQRQLVELLPRTIQSQVMYMLGNYCKLPSDQFIACLIEQKKRKLVA